MQIAGKNYRLKDERGPASWLRRRPRKDEKRFTVVLPARGKNGDDTEGSV